MGCATEFETTKTCLHISSLARVGFICGNCLVRGLGHLACVINAIKQEAPSRFNGVKYTWK